MTGPAIAVLVADLAAEQEDLDAVIADLPTEDWDRPTPAEGWTIHDQIAHLAVGEDWAVAATTDPEAFFAQLAEAAADIAGFEAAEVARGRALDPPDVLEWWRRSRSQTVAAVGLLDSDARIPWVGPPMKPRSFLTARLMETFAHGQDVRDALGITTKPTTRLRHVAHLGVATRGFSYQNRGRQPPEVEIRVELTGPDGEVWTWGPPTAGERISGPALDFCLVVTQRLNPADTDLEVSGEASAEWLSIAQCFAGPPTDNRPPRKV